MCVEELRGYARDASNGLSHEKLQEYINLHHPRRINHPELSGDTFEKFPICGTKIGSLSCIKSDRHSELEQFGPGLVVYFQSLKYFTSLFIIMTILSLPSMMFYLSGNMTIPSDLKSALTAISLGNIGATTLACNAQNPIPPEGGPETSKTTFNMQCSYGVLGKLQNWGQVSAFSFVSCEKYTTEIDEGDGSYQFPFYPQTCQWS
jgi:hypothetical protein